MQYLKFKKFNKIAGIYCIINTINNKRYIGSAVNLYERIRQHYHELISNIHFNAHLQKSFIKYGIDNFNVEIIETCDCPYEDLLKLEERYILEYNCLDCKFGYNKRLNFTFPELSQESIQKRSEKSAARKIKVKLFYADNGDFFADFDSVTDVAYFLHDQTTNVSKARDNLHLSCKGFTIISLNKYDPNKCYKKIPMDYSWSEERKNKLKRNSPCNKTVFEYDNKGILTNEYYSCTQATSILGLKKDSLSHLLKRYNTVIYKGLLYSYEKILTNFDEIYKSSRTYDPGVVKNQFTK